MLFNEVYGSYYNTVAAILSEAVNGSLTEKSLLSIVKENAFSESVLTIPEALRSESWPLLLPDNSTPLEHKPTMPLTTLQKRWLKSLMLDPRIQLFSPDDSGLEDVEPLYDPSSIIYYDRYSDGDLYGDKRYKDHFRTILTALQEKRKVKIRFTGHNGTQNSWSCIPCKLEYSSKDDKFRLVVQSPKGQLMVNLARMQSCELLETYFPDECCPQAFKKETLVIELTDERNTLERAMLHFSHLEKETARLDDNRYRLTIRYETEDETELLIRVLSFGPTLQVVSPDSFKAKLKERIEKQIKLRTQH